MKNPAKAIWNRLMLKEISDEHADRRWENREAYTAEIKIATPTSETRAASRKLNKVMAIE